MPRKHYQTAMALLFAINEINRNPHLLPNMSLEFSFLVGRMRNETTYLHSVLNFYANAGSALPNYICNAGKGIISLFVLTGPTFFTSLQLATYYHILNIPQMTFGSFHPLLNNHEQFPLLYQMAPKYLYLAHAMVSLMLHFSWTWVGLVILDDDQGMEFLSDLKGEMQRYEFCLAFVNVIPANMNLYWKDGDVYSNRIMTSSANVVIMYGYIYSSLGVSFARWKRLGIHRIWITTAQWDVIAGNDSTLDFVHGSITFSHHHSDICSFKNFFQTVKPSKNLDNSSLATLGWIRFNCSTIESNCKTFKSCFSATSLESPSFQSVEMSMSDESYNLYNAVYTVAHVIHQMHFQLTDEQQVTNVEGPVLYIRQLTHFLRTIQFTNPFGETISMNHKEILNTEFDIFRIWHFAHGLGLKVKIGQFTALFPHGGQLSVSGDMMELVIGNRKIPDSVCSLSCFPGFRKSPQEGKPACCFVCTPCPENEISNETGMDQCVKCPDDHYANRERNYCLPKTVSFLAYEDPLGMVLACMALCFSTFTALVLGIFIKHRDAPIVKSNNRTLSCILLISLTFCFLCSLLFIGYPTTITCLLQQMTFGVVFTLAVSTVLAKTITVVLAFKVTGPGRRMRWLLFSGAPNFIIPICTMIQVILCGVWLGTSPPFVDTDVHSEHGHIIIMCNKGSITAFYCVLGYLFSLALGTFTVAFLARNLPDIFNEAKFLTFSMLVFCSMWITFLPVYHSTKGKVMVAVEVFSILASSSGLLGCIFVPKCYVILLKPQKNSLITVRDKKYSKMLGRPP